jgi:hypothetical protein
VELEALFGLIYMRGVTGANLTDVSQLWSVHYSPVFAGTMSQNRFEFLLSHLRQGVHVIPFIITVYCEFSNSFLSEEVGSRGKV